MGKQRIRSVENLIQVLQTCAPDAPPTLVAEDADDCFTIQGVIQVLGPNGPEVWLMIGDPADESDDEGDVIEGQVFDNDEDLPFGDAVMDSPMGTLCGLDEPPEDCIEVRGLLKSA